MIDIGSVTYPEYSDQLPFCSWGVTGTARRGVIGCFGAPVSCAHLSALNKSAEPAMASQCEFYKIGMYYIVEYIPMLGGVLGFSK